MESENIIQGTGPNTKSMDEVQTLSPRMEAGECSIVPVLHLNGISGHDHSLRDECTGDSLSTVRRYEVFCGMARSKDIWRGRCLQSRSCLPLRLRLLATYGRETKAVILGDKKCSW